MLTAGELAAWRDAHLATGIKPASVVRVCKSLKAALGGPLGAALSLAAHRDHRVTNRAASVDGLRGLSEEFSSGNVRRLTDDQVRTAIAGADKIDGAVGLYCEVAAITGARVSQIARFELADLPADKDATRRSPANTTPWCWRSPDYFDRSAFTCRGFDSAGVKFA